MFIERRILKQIKPDAEKGKSLLCPRSNVANIRHGLRLAQIAKEA
jgi:hypothetical protein